MVLWLSAALAAIGFSLAATVRGEAERTGTALDGLRSYYLAVGGVQRASAELLWSRMYPNQRAIPQGASFVKYDFPSGVVGVEILPETGKLDVNNAPVEDLVRLLAALGVPTGRAELIAAAIDDWRRPNGEGAFDGFYAAQVPSFRPSHASFQEIEELLLVQGVTPELFYGTYVPADAWDGPPPITADGAPAPRLIPRGGLIDCLTVYGSGGQVDANTAVPAVLAAVGLPPFAVQALLTRRAQKPLTQGELGEFLQSVGAPGDRLRVDGNWIATLRATARLRLQDGSFSDLKRTVAMQVRLMRESARNPIEVLRWYDTAWSN